MALACHKFSLRPMHDSRLLRLKGPLQGSLEELNVRTQQNIMLVRYDEKIS